jgi:hypothetical protein
MMGINAWGTSLVADGGWGLVWWVSRMGVGLVLRDGMYQLASDGASGAPE